MDDKLRGEIDSLVNSEKVVLFMKGTKDRPMCGFSKHVVEILDHLEIDFKDVNILADSEIRQGMKDYTQWPTFPQLYVSGKFVGGCDIIDEMFNDGELEVIFQD